MAFNLEFTAIYLNRNNFNMQENRCLVGKIIFEEFPSDIVKLRNLIKKEVEVLHKKEFSTRPILSKTEIERISANQIKKEVKRYMGEEEIRKMIRQTLVNHYQWLYTNRNTWSNHA